MARSRVVGAPLDEGRVAQEAGPLEHGPQCLHPLRVSEAPLPRLELHVQRHLKDWPEPQLSGTQ